MPPAKKEDLVQGDPPATDVVKATTDAVRKFLVSLSKGGGAGAEHSFEVILERARTLVGRRRMLKGSRTDTRDLITELLFLQLRTRFVEFSDSPESADPVKAAEWVMGTLFATVTLTDLGAALDHALQEGGTSREFSFAGRSDFISIEEVLQMLSHGKRDGKLTLESSDNVLDIYLHNGKIASLDPMHLVRRVLPSPDGINFMEIPREKLELAEARRVEDGRPLVLDLVDQGVFKKKEIRELIRGFGREILYKFLREQETCSFYYQRLLELPDFAVEHHLHMPVTGILLDVSKVLDDWQAMLKVFPDPDARVVPQAEMLARIGELNLGVLEIKLLTQIDGNKSARQLAEAMGLPLHDTIQYLVKLAREGAVEVPGGIAALEDLSMSVEESMQMAFECLDANDTKAQRESALDKVLGGLDGEADSAQEEDDDDVGRDFIRSMQGL